MGKKIKGTGCLLFATLIWGSTFVAQSVGMDHIGPFTFLAARCFLAVLALLAVIWISDKIQHRNFAQQWKNFTLWKTGTLCGSALFIASGLQQFGLIDTSAGKAGFITAMYIVLVPVLGLFLKKKPSKTIWFSVCIAVCGLYLLSCAGTAGISPGDLLLLACALAFAVQITMVDRYAGSVDPLRFNCVQSLVCAIICSICMIFTEQPSVQQIADCWLPISYAGVLSMGFAFTLQIVGQKELEPSVASLIMSLESVFAALSGWLILNETMTAVELLGCALVLSSVILAQLPSRNSTVKAAT